MVSRAVWLVVIQVLALISAQAQSFQSLSKDPLVALRYA